MLPGQTPNAPAPGEKAGAMMQGQAPGDPKELMVSTLQAIRRKAEELGIDWQALLDMAFSQQPGGPGQGPPPPPVASGNMP